MRQSKTELFENAPRTVERNSSRTVLYSRKRLAREARHASIFLTVSYSHKLPSPSSVVKGHFASLLYSSLDGTVGCVTVGSSTHVMLHCIFFSQSQLHFTDSNLPKCGTPLYGSQTGSNHLFMELRVLLASSHNIKQSTEQSVTVPC